MTSVRDSSALAVYGLSIGSGSTISSAVVAYKSAIKDADAQITQGEKDATIANEIKYFKSKVGNLKSVADLYKDQRLVNFVMKGVGLGDKSDMMGIFKKAMSESPDADTSLVNKLGDKSWLAAAQTLKMDSTGVTTLQSAEMIDLLSKQYARSGYQTSLREKNSAVPLALYFKDNASKVTSYYGILGDSTIRKVVTTALGLPDELAYQPVATQAKAIQAKFDLADLQSPEKVERFVAKFLVMADAKNNVSSSSKSYLVNLFA